MVRAEILEIDKSHHKIRQNLITVCATANCCKSLGILTTLFTSSLSAVFISCACAIILFLSVFHKFCKLLKILN